MIYIFPELSKETAGWPAGGSGPAAWTPVEMLWISLLLCGYLPDLPILTTIISYLDDCNGFLLEGHMAPVTPSHHSLGALGPCTGSGVFMTWAWF